MQSFAFQDRAEPRPSVRNLILIHRGPEYVEDFNAVADGVTALAPGTRVFHLPANLETRLPAGVWEAPSLTVSLAPDFRLNVLRGAVLRNRQIPKLRQQDIFRAAAIPTPAAATFRFGMKLDPIMFGEFVVLKPGDLRLTSTGENIHLFRRRRAEAVTPGDFPPGHPLRRDPGSYIVQRFVDTGLHVSYNRVMSFFGRPLYVTESSALAPRPALDAPDAEIEAARIANLGAGPKRPYRLHADLDVLALARRVHNALPDIPLLGIDIIREERTGRLFVLECNPGGNGWHFSSRGAAEWRVKLARSRGYAGNGAERVGRRILIEQFDALASAARMLVRQLDLHAV